MPFNLGASEVFASSPSSGANRFGWPGTLVIINRLSFRGVTDNDRRKNAECSLLRQDFLSNDFGKACLWNRVLIMLSWAGDLSLDVVGVSLDLACSEGWIST